MGIQEIIASMYKDLEISLRIDDKIVGESVIITFMGFKSNVRFRYLIDSSQDLSRSDQRIVHELIKKKLIRPSEEVNAYILTGHGIWEVEKNRLNEDSLIEFIDQKYFNISKGSENLSDKEKIIILSFIAIRAFSESFSIDLKRDDYALDSCKKVIDRSYNLLFDLKLIKRFDQESLYGKKGNEHYVSHLIRHTDNLPKKTKGIFRAPGNQKYFLDLSDNNTLNIVSLAYLIDKCVPESVEDRINKLERIKQDCYEIAYEQAPYLFDNIKESYSVPKYDRFINEAFTKKYMG